jgi:acetyl esterase/lipase
MNCFRPPLACLFGLLLFQAAVAAERAEIVLWPDGMPEPHVDASAPERVEKNAAGFELRFNISNPRLIVFESSAEKRTGAAVIVVPGGGFGRLADEHEGSEACVWLNTLGVTAFLLEHRCPTNTHPEPNLGPAQDTQRAVQLVRQRVAEWQLDPQKIGVLGFSAGGQVALVAATNTPSYSKAGDREFSHRPSFLVLAYPYRIYDEKANAIRADIKLDVVLPPTFISQCSDDTASLAQGSTLLFLDLIQRKVPAELHIYQRGGHGYGMRPRPNATGPTDWPLRAADWLKQHGWAK